VLAVAVLGAGAWAFVEASDAPGLRVSNILVAGSDLVPAEEIANALPMTHVNVFTVRGSRLANAITGDPAIESVRVEPHLPDTIYVRVRERRAAVVWDTPAGPLLTDDTGLVLREGTRSLPVVWAAEGPAPEPGGRVDRHAVLAAETIAPRIDTLGLPGGRVEFQPSTGVALVAPGRSRVVLGFNGNLEAQLAAYEAIRRYLEQSRAPAELIDVRFLDRPFYR
jgi:cell division protein FtsQ